MMRVILLIAGLIGPGAIPVAAQEFSGRMVFSDADTLRVGNVKVRLFGIDAPEADQTCTRDDGRVWRCGDWATRQAKRLFNGRRATCRGLDRSYDRIVARCTALGVDIAEVLVERGIAAAYLRFTRAYVDGERAARAAKNGVWSGPFQRPEEWRASQRTNAATRTRDCRIKGNISGGGRIYHLPGQENYDATRISPSKGERWFCTEAEARAAGWRRARR